MIRNPPGPASSEDRYDVGPDDPSVRRTVCPNCGARRLGGFRYCRTCAYDFDVAERVAAMRRRSPAFRLDSGRDGVQRHEGSAENDAAVDAAEPIVRVGSGRFVVTKRSFLITAAAVGLTAAGLVSLVAIVLPH